MRAIDAILELERRLPVRDLEIADVHIWPLLRFHLHLELIQKLIAIQNGSSLSPPNERTGEFRRLLSVLSSGGQRVGGVKAGNEPALALFLSYSTYRDPVNGVWVDRFCDPLIQEMTRRGYGYVFLERQNQAVVKRPAPSQVRYVNHELALATARVLLRRPRVEPAIRRTLAEAKSVWDSLQVPVPFPTVKWISKRLEVIRSMSDVFLRWIRASGSRIGITASYYSITGLAFNLACRRARIPSVDIQHGLQNNDHCGYAAWLSIPETGYEMLPTIFWCWSDMEKEQIESWAGNSGGAHGAIVGGNVWHEFCAAGGFEDAEDRKSGSRNILVTLQPWPTDITQLITEVIKLTPSDWIWWLRLHPAMREESNYESTERSFAGFKNVRVREATDTPLPILLRKADLHITPNSSAIFEASQYGVPSIMTDRFLVATFEAEFDKGMAALAETPAEIAALARSWVERPREAATAPERHMERGLAALYAAAGLQAAGVGAG